MFHVDPTYLLIAIPALLGWLAQAAIRRAYAKYQAVPGNRGMTGVDAAKHLLASEGLSNVTINSEPGVLTDHYDPVSKTLSLSEGSANSTSLAALGVVAHEVGHAAQDAEGYRAMRFRTAMSHRLAQVGRWSSLVFLGGMLIGSALLMGLGLVMLAAFALFALVTIPLERNASARALRLLETNGLISSGEEKSAIWQVLRAAALTYAASFGRQAAMLLFYALIAFTVQGTWRV